MLLLHIAVLIMRVDADSIVDSQMLPCHYFWLYSLYKSEEN